MERVLVFSCPHIPLLDKSAEAFLFKQIKETNPTYLVCLGDLLEADGASRWPSEYKWTLHDEFVEADSFLSRLRRHAPPGCKLVLLEGNHDANVLAINRIDPKLRGLCDYRKLIPEIADGHWDLARNYIYDAVKGVYRIGDQIRLAHGYEANQSADRFQSVLLGGYNTLTVCGHTHRPMAVTQTMLTQAVPLPNFYANPGCMRSLAPEYVKRNRHHGWGHAVVYIECVPTKSPREKISWAAETRFHRMASSLFPLKALA